MGDVLGLMRSFYRISEELINRLDRDEEEHMYPMQVHNVLHMIVVVCT
jgi:hypothetical protein